MQQIKSIAITWMAGRHKPEVMKILRSFRSSIGDESDLVRTLRQRNGVGMVAMTDDKIVGCMVYELHKKSIQVAAFGVLPEMRRIGVGSLLMAMMKAKLSLDRRWILDFVVHDSELVGHLFLRSQGFKAVEVLRGMYEDGDAYRFRYRCLNA